MVLELLLELFGGTITPVTGKPNVYRYRLHNRVELISLISAINSKIYNPFRVEQLSLIYLNYNIPFQLTAPLTYYNGWLSGFFDADDSIYLGTSSDQLFITASKNILIQLTALQALYGGSIYSTKSGNRSSKWVVSNKHIIAAIRSYFSVCPCRSSKVNRFNAISRYYELRGLKAHLAPANSSFGVEWSTFLSHWDNFS